MNREQVLLKIKEVFIDVLDDESISLDENTSADDIEDWDSLSHIQLVVGIEKAFNVRFTSSEIQEWKNVGEMINCMEKKTDK
jgi:acyl carrier protein